MWGILERARQTHRRSGVSGVLSSGLDRLLLRPLGLRFVRVLVLDRVDRRSDSTDPGLDVRWLDVDEISRFAENPANQIGTEFVSRARGGHDLCMGIIRGERLASYAWCALGSVESEHAAGVDLELPEDTAYLYKGFTHPDDRGARLYPACMHAALASLSERGVERLIAFVHWHNASALRSCERAGYRVLGTLRVGPGSALSVPPAVRNLGVRFGADARVLPRT